MKRRHFIKKTSLTGAGLVSLPVFSDTVNLLDHFNFNAEPSRAQKSWMDLEFGMYIHFGINTYYDKEVSDGLLDPYRFDPELINTDQWCQVARNAGMKYLVIVAKHNDGFCLWPSRHTDYTISRSRYTRDILAALVNSAAKYGLKTGFHYSLWDQHQSEYITDEWKFTDFIEKQLTELLTNYGPVAELRLDGFWKRQQSGWEGKPDDTATISPDSTGTAQSRSELMDRNENFIYSWRMEGAYRWQMDYLYNFIKSLQPDCILLNNSTASYPGVPLFPVDARSGLRYTDIKTNRQRWEWLGSEVFLPLQIETTMSTKGDQQFPEGNWYWHSWDHSVLTRESIEKIQKTSRQVQANLLLNVGPDTNGRLRPEDVRVLSELHE